MQFTDGEQFVSLHRWGWLLRAVSTNRDRSTNLEWGLYLMRSWLASKTALPKGLASEPYTVSERIVNAVLFCRLVGGDWQSMPCDIERALVEKAKFLTNNLEYAGLEGTGNHPLNNGRALYFAAQQLGNMELREMAKKIIEERLDVLISESGFVYENSTLPIPDHTLAIGNSFCGDAVSGQTCYRID